MIVSDSPLLDALENLLTPNTFSPVGGAAIAVAALAQSTKQQIEQHMSYTAHALNGTHILTETVPVLLYTTVSDETLSKANQKTVDHKVCRMCASSAWCRSPKTDSMMFPCKLNDPLALLLPR